MVNYTGMLSGGPNIILFDVTAGNNEISQCNLYFHYAVKDKTIDRTKNEFYLAVYRLRVTDYTSAYDDTKAQLTSLYGEGKEKSYKETGAVLSDDYNGSYVNDVTECTWTGTNSTFVTLRCVNNTSIDPELVNCGVSIAYGNASDDKDVKALRSALRKEQAAQQKISSDNTEGL
jgi:hypothetical protein